MADATSLVSGQGTSTSTAARITAGTTTWVSGQSVTGLMVLADSANTAAIFVGGSGVTTGNGLKLAAGAGQALDIQDPAAVYVVSAASQSFSWVGTAE